MSQKINRKNLHTLYESVKNCSTWKNKIDQILTEQKFNNEIEVEDSVINDAYSQADTNQKKLLKQYFTLPESIIDTINGIDDIYTILKIERILPYPKPSSKFERHLNACYDIPHITKAYNGNVILDFLNKSQRKYYIWWERTAGGWVLGGVSDCYYCSRLGFGSYFATEEAAKDAAKKFKDVFLDYLPE